MIKGAAFVQWMPPSENHPLGSPNVDPEAEQYEGSVHNVELKPFFLSKYEMTQGQWLKFTGRNPSHYHPIYTIGDKKHTLLHPVENVNWNDCAEVLFQLNLRFPSESEWEYATRAETTTIWWTGNERKSLAGAANLLDRYYNKIKGQIHYPYEEWLDDGYSAHAPVGTFLPNAFGLHDVHGNQVEMCEDIFNDHYEITPIDGSAIRWGSSSRITRGGSWLTNAFTSRSSFRHGINPMLPTPSYGLRPAASCP